MSPQELADIQSASAIKKITWTVRAAFLAPLLLALAEGIHAAAPAVMAYSPGWAAPLVTLGTAALVKLLGELAKKEHDDAVTTALFAAAPDGGIDPFYKKP